MEMTNAFSNIARKVALAAFAAMVACVLAMVGTSSAFADDGSDDAYTFTVTLLSGNQGQLVDNVVAVRSSTASAPVYSPGKITISGLSYGDQVMFPNNVAAVDSDSKYYVKGVRMGGRDNTEAENVSPTFTVTEDRDYVVAYGMKGSVVEYTVRFVDNEGNPLLDDRKYIGNVGDTPVAAYVYIDGYRPQAYNITGTLKDNPQDNIFEFVYTPVAEFEEQPTPAAPATPTEPTAVTTNGGIVAPAPGAPGGADEATIADDGTPLDQPEELLNIDDNQNPLATPEAHPAFSENGNDLIIWPLVATWVLLIGAIIAFASWLLIRRKRDRDMEEAVENYTNSI